jgi:hypothetical protein
LWRAEDSVLVLQALAEGLRKAMGIWQLREQLTPLAGFLRRVGRVDGGRGVGRR